MAASHMSLINQAGGLKSVEQCLQAAVGVQRRGVRLPAGGGVEWHGCLKDKQEFGDQGMCFTLGSS